MFSWNSHLWSEDLYYEGSCRSYNYLMFNVRDCCNKWFKVVWELQYCDILRIEIITINLSIILWMFSFPRLLRALTTIRKLITGIKYKGHQNLSAELIDQNFSFKIKLISFISQYLSVTSNKNWMYANENLLCFKLCRLYHVLLCTLLWKMSHTTFDKVSQLLPQILHINAWTYLVFKM